MQIDDISGLISFPAYKTFDQGPVLGKIDDVVVRGAFDLLIQNSGVGKSLAQCQSMPQGNYTIELSAPYQYRNGYFCGAGC